MPISEYKCETCRHELTEMRPMPQMEALAVCPVCGGEAKHKPSVPGRFQRGSGWGARMDGASMPGEVS